MAISIPPQGDEAKRAGAFFAPLTVLPQEIPDMTVRVLEGGFFNAELEFVEFSGGSSVTITAPGSLAKLVVVALDENGLLQLFDGAISSNPCLPTLPKTVLPLAAVFVGDTTTAITSGSIFDIRPLFMVSTEQVADLQQELDDRPTIDDVNLLLAAKADLDGTTDVDWCMNKDFVSGTPTANVRFKVERGAAPTVDIRWNESADQWEFTNDGSVWDAIGTSSLAPHTHVVADITDFNTGVDVRLAASNVSIHTDVQVSGVADGEILIYRSSSSEFVNEVLSSADISDLDPADFADVVHTHNIVDVVGLQTELDNKADDVHSHPISQLSDFASVTPSNRHVLVYNGTSLTYENRLLTVADISDHAGGFVDTTTAQSIGGVKTFTDVPIFDVGIDMDGNPVSVNEVSLADLTGGDFGLTIDRGGDPDALLFWDETADLWFAGVLGDVFPLASPAVFYTKTEADLLFAPIIHAHLVADITDFAAGVTAEFPSNPLNLLSDVGAYVSLTVNDALLWDGGDWQNRPIVKTDVSDFVETDYVLTGGSVAQAITGVKTFSDDVIVSGDLTVNGTNNTINTATLTVADNVIEINQGEVGAGVTAGTAGLLVDRGTKPDVQLFWDETADLWRLQNEFPVGSGTIVTSDIEIVGHTHLLADLTDISVSATEVNHLSGVTSNVQTQLDARVLLAGDTMTGLLTLSGAPTVDLHAATKLYVDTVALAQDELGELTDVDLDGAGAPAAPALANRDGLLYDLANTRWTNRPIVEADVSDLQSYLLPADIGSTVQAWDDDLDDLAALAHTGDEMIFSVAGTWTVLATTAFGRGFLAEATAATTRTTLDLYSATELDAGQLDNQYYTETELDAVGPAAGAKVDKVTGVSGNVVEFGASNAIADSGIVAADVLTTASVIDDLADVTDVSSEFDLLQKGGGGQWENVSPSSLIGFVHTQDDIAESITGEKTFSDDVIIGGNLTVNGTTTTVNSSTVELGDSIIELNAGETGAPSINGGIEIERGTSTNSTLLWDEAADEWQAGIVGSLDTLALVGVHTAQPDYELFAGTGAGFPTYVAAFSVPVTAPPKTPLQVFVNGIKQVEGAGKAFTVVGISPLTITFTGGSEPAVADDVEIYGFGTIA